MVSFSPGDIQAGNYDCLLVAAERLSYPLEQMLEAILQHKQELPLLVWLRESSSEDRVRVLEMGADNCADSSISVVELRTKIKVLARRTRRRSKDTLSLGNLQLNPREGLATVDGVVILLTKKEFELLCLLFQSRHAVLSKEELASALWPDFAYSRKSDNIIFSHIKNLKQKLSKSGARVGIRTVYSRGYQLQVNQTMAEA